MIVSLLVKHCNLFFTKELWVLTSSTVMGGDAGANLSHNFKING